MLTSPAALVGDRIGLADLAVAAQLAGFRHGGFRIDAGRFPKLAAWLEAMLARESLARLLAEDRELLGRYSRIDA